MFMVAFSSHHAVMEKPERNNNLHFMYLITLPLLLIG